MQDFLSNTFDSGAGDPEVGSIFEGRYLLEECLGRGGHGVVYKAKDIQLGRDIAIKIVKLRTADATKRFQREASVLVGMHHPNIVSVLCAGVCDSETEAYIVFEFLDGIDLGRFIATYGRLGIGTLLKVLEQVARAMHYAHDSSVIHRDLKPENVVVKENGNEFECKIIDFGSAKMLSDYCQQTQRLTRTGDLFGTAGYMSPEQLKGEPADARSDIYAFGIMARELCGEDVPVPAELQSLIRKCVQANPSNRYQSFQPICDLLGSISPQQPVRNKRRTTLLVIASLITLGSIAFIAVPSCINLVGMQIAQRRDIARFRELSEQFRLLKEQGTLPHDEALKIDTIGKELLELTARVPKEEEKLRALDAYIDVYKSNSGNSIPNGNYPTIRSALEQASTILKAKGANRDPRDYVYQMSLADIDIDDNRLPEAEERIKNILVPMERTHSHLYDSMHERNISLLTKILRKREQFEEGCKLLKKEFSECTSLGAKRVYHGSLMTMYMKHAQVLLAEGKRNEAEKVLLTALNGYEQEPALYAGRLPTETAFPKIDLLSIMADVLAKRGDGKKASLLREQAVSLAEELDTKNWYDSADRERKLGVLYQKLHRYDQSLKAFRQSVELYTQHPGNNFALPEKVLTEMLLLHEETKSYKEAEEVAKLAIAGYEKQIDQVYSGVIDVMVPYARVLRALHKNDEAKAVEIKYRSLAKNWGIAVDAPGPGKR
jgi:serine/threonine protein kinase